jgi:predicted  nucleic acid-binding Zn-ribbon protein
MRAQIKRLLELQVVDVRLADLRAKLAAFAGRAAEVDARLAGAKNKLAAAREALTNSLKERKKYELDVEQWRERGKKYRDQSYEVKTNDAFRALQHEIKTADDEMAGAEDRLLERMVAGEEFERQVKSGEIALKEAEGAAAAEKRALEEERAAEQGKLEAAEAEHKGVVAEIPEGLLAEYHRIGKRHSGVALAEVRDEMCMKCGVRVRPHIYQVLRRAENEEVHVCESCGRILYVAEPAVPPALAGGEPPPAVDASAATTAQATSTHAHEN